MNLEELSALLSANPVLALAIVSILAAVLGWRLEREAPRPGKLLNHGGYLGMAAALMLTVAQSASEAEGSDAAMLLAHRPALAVQGSETQVPMASDGHFWIEAEANGEKEWFLIDTGATYSALSQSAAKSLGVEPDPIKLPVELSTANGMVTARFGTIRELRFGNVAVENLDTTILPNESSDTSLIGMNLLSRLESWRVEGEKLVLVPKQ